MRAVTLNMLECRIKNVNIKYEEKENIYFEEGDDIGHQHMVFFGRYELRSRHHIYLVVFSSFHAKE